MVPSPSVLSTTDVVVPIPDGGLGNTTQGSVVLVILADQKPGPHMGVEWVVVIPQVLCEAGIPAGTTTFNGQ
jgi:hypothetical protein